MNQHNIIRLASRGSALALWQANRVRNLILARYPDYTVEIIAVSTVPDRNPNQPLSALGGDKGLFVKELELAVLDGRADAAVHSLKDVPIDDLTGSLELVAFPERADPRDVFISSSGDTLATIAPGSTIATSAPRRRAQVLGMRPDLKTCDVRGNVETRLRKLDERQFDGIILAAAGLERLGLQKRITEILPVDKFVPAPGQGILAIEAHSDSPFLSIWQAIDSSVVRIQAEAERHFSRAIGADCHTAAGCYLELTSDTATLHACRWADDGSHVGRYDKTGSLDSIPGLIREAVDRIMGDR